VRRTFNTQWETIDDVETFLYLESVLTEEGVSEQDTKIASARHIHNSFEC